MYANNVPKKNTPESLPWMKEAFSHIGLQEIKGPKHSPAIQAMLRDVGASWSDDETPWCATFVSACLKRANRGYPTKSPAWARSYDTNGVKLKKPAFGCTATKARKGGGGHVFFVVGTTDKGGIVGLGGNQNDSVNLAVFKPSEITSYNWPPLATGTAAFPTEGRYTLPVYDSANLKLSTKES